MLHLGEQPTCDRGTRLTVGREGAGRGHGGGVCAASWLRMGRAVHIRLPPATLSFGCLGSSLGFPIGEFKRKGGIHFVDIVS